MNTRALAGIAICLGAMLCLSGCLSSLLPEFKPSHNINVMRLERAVEYNPDNPHAYFLLGRASLKEGDYKKAEENFRRAIDLNPVFEEAWRGYGIAQMDQKKYKNAAKVYADMASRFPESAAARAGQASAAYALAEMESARLYATEALELDSDSSQALRVLGEIAYVQGDYEAAVDYWSRAIKGNADLEKEYGSLLEDLKQYAEKY